MKKNYDNNMWKKISMKTYKSCVYNNKIIIVMYNRPRSTNDEIYYNNTEAPNSNEQQRTTPVKLNFITSRQHLINLCIMLA